MIDAVLDLIAPATDANGEGMGLVQFDAPDKAWLNRKEAIAWLGISKREFYRLMQTNPAVFHGGRPRGDSPRRWYSQRDCAWMKEYVMNQALYQLPPEIPVKPKKGGVSTG